MIRMFALALTGLGAAVTPLAAQTLTTLHSFSGGTDGQLPQGQLIYAQGLLYGTTFQGGTAGCSGGGCGTVFAIDPSSGTETILHRFLGAPLDGQFPEAGLLYQGGTFYGTTAYGGPPDLGTIFTVDARTAAENVLHDFSGGAGGGNPAAPLVEANGSLAGTTTLGDGAVFEANPATGATTALHRFRGRDGELPLSGMTVPQPPGRYLFGTTYEGGRYAAGEIYKIDQTNGALTVLYAFTGGADGGGPAGVIQNGKYLYGTTYRGGAAGCGGGGCGTVFKFDTDARVETVLYAFTGGSDGNGPQSNLVLVAGALYGTNRGALAGCDTNGCGTIFQVDAATGAETTLYRFTGGSDGGLPLAGLTYVGGAFYGVTDLAGDLGCNNGMGCGTVFKLTP